MGDSSLFDGMVVFVKTVEIGSFSKAAEILGHSASYVSKEISKLESRLGVRLLNRTTRSITLTSAGKQYFERSQQLVIDAQSTEQAIGSMQAVPKGVLKLTAPVSLGRAHLNTILAEFLKAYPEVDLDVDYSQRKVDLVAEGYDVAIRIGTLQDSNLVAKRIGETPIAYLASPDYLKQYGTPESPSKLSSHRVISYSNLSTPKYWEFRPKSEEKVNIKVNPRLVCNDADLQVEVGVAGIAMLQLPTIFCREEIANGKLVEILPSYAPEKLGIYAVYPHRKFLSAKVDVFIKFIAKKLKT
ncbi:LysR family transcriptional regulator [Thalassotalea marina]|uniref:LysR family transcriptional regulator n=1 Tax=Thalassotalea marina TaxID=1673741 RepID=A0A919BEA1_9GAMM|nr:LysR family transcriptional regulator [Thalassotalea marina]GHF83003.1 LysR family transcriptional regulator [Thalassotalea marina]